MGGGVVGKGEGATEGAVWGGRVVAKPGVANDPLVLVEDADVLEYGFGGVYGIYEAEEWSGRVRVELGDVPVLVLVVSVLNIISLGRGPRSEVCLGHGRGGRCRQRGERCGRCNKWSARCDGREERNV